MPPQQVAQFLGTVTSRFQRLVDQFPAGDKEHAVAVALAMRAGASRNDLFERLAADPRLGLGSEQLADVVTDPLELTGSSGDQVDRIVARVAELAKAHPVGAAYRPGSVL